jgi:cellulose binding protein with CBM2 domain
MRRRLGAALAMAALLIAGAAAPAAAAPTPGPTLTCPPALPISGWVSATTERSLTISYSMLLTPPCGYDPPVTVTLFASPDDARQWHDPLTEAVSGPERNGKVTIDGLSPDTAYWYRFTASGTRDPYVVGTGRTAAVAACAATVTIDSAWNGGFVATVTVRNVGAEALASWYVSWRWSGDERIVSLWNAVARDSDSGVAVGNASYNGTVVPAGSTTFGMLVAGTPPTALTPACTR